MSRRGSVRGIAILLAVVALAALGVITATGFALAREERMAGLAALARTQARGAAEGALAEALQGWATARTPRSAGEETRLIDLTVPGPAEGTATIRALGGRIYSLHADGIRRSLGGDVLASVQIETLILLDSIAADSTVRPRVYPRGWRILP